MDTGGVTEQLRKIWEHHAHNLLPEGRGCAMVQINCSHFILAGSSLFKSQVALNFPGAKSHVIERPTFSFGIEVEELKS
jgi:hypothetical protein